MWSLSRLFGRKNKTKKWENIVLAGEVNPRYLLVIPLVVFAVFIGWVLIGSAGMATILPFGLVSLCLNFIYFRRQMFRLELNVAELRILNMWGMTNGRAISVDDIDAFEFSMIGRKRKVVRIRISYGNATKTCRMYGLAFDAIAKFKHKLQILNPESAVSTHRSAGSTGDTVQIALTNLFANRAQQFNMTAPNRWIGREYGVVFRLINSDSSGAEPTYEVNSLVPENIVIARQGEQITDKRFASKACVVITVSMWSTVDHVNARVYLTYAVEHPELGDEVMFIFLLFDDVQRAERFFGGKRVLSSSPLTYYAFDREIKQKRMVVQTPAKIDRDIEMLLASKTSE